MVQNRYTYDGLGQLIREDNRALGKTYVWTYDNAGNILTKKTYAFTTSNTLGTLQSTQTYTYGDANWGDLLTGFGGKTITYDSIGNPVAFGDWENGEGEGEWDHLTWSGRELQNYYHHAQDGEGDFELSFTYNSDGIRTSKAYEASYDDVYYKREYHVDGSTIIREILYYGVDGDWYYDGEIYYLYDETGSPIGMAYREVSYAAGVYDYYFFEKNLQGDIIAIYNENGTKVGSYTYDAWGNCTVSGGTIASLNPFRYRGYYYDTETGYYYLQSRYYNPTWGRFINADGYVNANGDLLGFNMFAYCGNNPVMGYDPFGTVNIAEWWDKVTNWVDDNIIDPIGELAVEITFAVIDFVYPENDINSLQFGETISAGCGAGITYSYGFAMDREGNIGRYNTIGFGGAAGCGVSREQTITFSNAKEITDFYGLGVTLGGSVSVPIHGVSVGGGYDYSIVGPYSAHTFSFGVGTGYLPAEFHANLTWTWYTWRNNVYD